MKSQKLGNVNVSASDLEWVPTAMETILFQGVGQLEDFGTLFELIREDNDFVWARTLYVDLDETTGLLDTVVGQMFERVKKFLWEDGYAYVGEPPVLDDYTLEEAGWLE